MNIESLNEFIEWASQFNDGQYLFRGVSKDCYKVEASAYRRLKTNKTPARLLKVNQELIEKAKSRGHDQKNGQELSDLELLAELQHYGAATCLIDFSRNALVALWFACQQSSRGEANGKVFAVRSDDPARFKTVTPRLIEEDIDYFFKLDELGKYPLYQWEPKLQNNRIIAQHSVFVFGGAQVDIGTECVIVQSRKQAILKSLDQISDITEASVYPDFDGFARLHAHDKPYVEPDALDLMQRGIGVHQRGDLDDAIAYYTEIIELDPSHTSVVAQAYYNRGVAYEQKDNYERAIEDFSKAIKLSPDLYEAYHNRGIVYGETGNYERAIKDFSKAIDLEPDLAEAYYNRGQAYGQKGNHEHAIEDYTKTIELNPDLYKAYHNRGRAYGTKAEYERAIENLNKAMELNPMAETYYDRGVIWLHLEEWEKAKLDLTTAKEKGVNIISEFCNDCESVPDFQRETGITIPEDIAEILTPT